MATIVSYSEGTEVRGHGGLGVSGAKATRTCPAFLIFLSPHALVFSSSSSLLTLTLNFPLLYRKLAPLSLSVTHTQILSRSLSLLLFSFLSTFVGHRFPSFVPALFFLFLSFLVPLLLLEIDFPILFFCLLFSLPLPAPPVH